MMKALAATMVVLMVVSMVVTVIRNVVVRGSAAVVTVSVVVAVFEADLMLSLGSPEPK